MAEFINKHKELWEDARNHFGTNTMFRWLQEELAECSVATAHFYRGKIGKDDLLDECADALLMISQVVNVFDVNLFNKIVEQKCSRLRSKITEGITYRLEQP